MWADELGGGEIRNIQNSGVEQRLTSKCMRLTVRMTTNASLLVSIDPLTGALMAWANDSKRPLTVSKFLLVFSDIKYFPAARTQLSDVNGY